MVYLTEAELDSLLRGELNVVRVLPMRQHRHSQVIITAPLATQTTSSPLPSVAPSVGQVRVCILKEIKSVPRCPIFFGLTWLNYNQCSTLTFLDTSQWASKRNKSLAYKDKSLVQNMQGPKAFCKMTSVLKGDHMKPPQYGFDCKSSSFVTQATAHFQ